MKRGKRERIKYEVEEKVDFFFKCEKKNENTKEEGEEERGNT